MNTETPLGIFCWKCDCNVPIRGEDAFLEKQMNLPIPPFPGLHIGGFIVSDVYVCQSADILAIEVQMRPVTPETADIYEKKHGWTRTDY